MSRNVTNSSDACHVFCSPREACGIPGPGWFTVTGGMARSQPGDALRRVMRYGRSGEAETLAPLNVGRYHHACGSYLTDDGDSVSLIYNIYEVGST